MRSLIGSGSTDSYHWTTLPDPDPDLSFSGFQDALMVLLITLVLTLGNFPSVFKENESLRNHGTVKIKVFLVFF